MEQLTLKAKIRKATTKGYLKKMRNAKRVPGIIYGLTQENTLFEVEQNKLEKCIGGKNKNKVIEIDIDGKKEKTIVYHITRHPVKQYDIIHIDLLRVNESHPVIVKVPIEHKGVSFGVKNEAGYFQVMKKFVKLKCKIADIPEIFTMDISDLHTGDVVYAKDLKVANASILTPPKTALFGVTGKSGVQEIEEPTPATPEEGAEGEEDKKAEGGDKAKDDEKDKGEEMGKGNGKEEAKTDDKGGDKKKGGKKK